MYKNKYIVDDFKFNTKWVLFVYPGHINKINYSQCCVEKLKLHTRLNI